MTVSVHTVVCNEERYIWYSLMSVAHHVDRLFVWDTGSTDSTVKIIKKIKEVLGDKLEFQEIGKTNPHEFTEIRKEMIAKTKTDWFLILDGDEVWWESSVRRLIKILRREGDRLDSLVVPYYNLIGDIYHYQDESLGKYKIDGRKGFLTIRAINSRIPGLSLVNPHPLEAYIDKDGVPIQERPKKQRKFVDAKYMHFTHLLRSEDVSKNSQATSRGKKYKYELGREFPLDFYYPEVFFRERPSIVKSVWEVKDLSFYLRAGIETYLRRIKRRIIR